MEKNKTTTTKCILLILSDLESPEMPHVSTLPLPSDLKTTETVDINFDDFDYTLDILMPLFVGLLVALILGWMLIRYKMSAHQRSNYNGSIYCCPEQCFQFCAKFFECNIKLKKSKRMKRAESTNPQIVVRFSEFNF